MDNNFYGSDSGSQGISATLPQPDPITGQKRMPRKNSISAYKAASAVAPPDSILKAATNEQPRGFTIPAEDAELQPPSTYAPEVGPQSTAQMPYSAAPSSVQPSEPRITPLLGLPDNTPSPSTSTVLDATTGAAQESKVGMPTLANPHPFLRKLGAYFGLSGPEPNPGELYSGPTSAQ